MLCILSSFGAQYFLQISAVLQICLPLALTLLIPHSLDWLIYIQKVFLFEDTHNNRYE